MKAITARLKNITWRYWLLSACAFLYLVFLSVSFFYLPGKLKTLTETDVSGIIGREITVDNIHFNPFKLSLSIKGLSVSDPSGDDPLVAWDQLLVNFGFLKSVFSWGIVFNEITLDNPRIHIVKYENDFNFSDILEKVTASDSEEGKKDVETGAARSIAVEIFNTSINKGSFKYIDRSGNTPASAGLDDISIRVNELYFATGDDHLNTFSIYARTNEGGEMGLNGDYRIDPLYVEGNISVKGVNLASMSKFVENMAPVSLSKGMLSFDTDLLIKEETDLILKTENGNLSIIDLFIDDTVPEPSMLRAGNISIHDFSLDITGQKVMVEDVTLDNITLNQWIDENGSPRYESLLPEKNQEATETASGAKSGIPWDIMVRQVSLKNSAINFEDRNEKITRGHSLSGITLDLKNVSTVPDSKMPVELAAILDEHGAIDIKGFVSPSPLLMELDYHIDKVLLNPFSEYLETVSWLSVEDGNLSVDGKVSMKEGKKVSINAVTSLGVDDIKFKDTRTGESVFSLKTFRLDNIRTEVDKQKVSIASVQLAEPDLSLAVSEEKKLNLSGLMKEKKTQKDPETPDKKNDPSSAWKFEIEKISLNEGKILFSDKSIKPAYKTGLHNMSFSMDRFGSDVKGTAPFTFKAEIDKYAPFTVAGSLDPVAKQPGFDFTSTLNGLDMSQLSPYSGFYIGNNLKSGKLSLNLDYTLHDGKLKGKNNINAKDLYLGEKLPVEPVIDAPVGLGLALLRDISGVIDLDVGVSGDLDDPGFSVTGVIVKALVNIIVKAAASPFKLLGALVPGGSEDLGNITFDPGLSALNQEGRDSLKTLADALNKRQQLMLVIKGNASEKEDIEALRKAQLRELIAKNRGIDLSVLEEELEAQDLWLNEKNLPALEAINNEMGLIPLSERIEKLSTEADQEHTGDLQDIKTQDKSEIQQAALKQVYGDILSNLKIDENELISLAEERALHIKQYLVEDLKLSQERVTVIKTTQADLTGRIIALGLDVM